MTTKAELISTLKKEDKKIFTLSEVNLMITSISVANPMEVLYIKKGDVVVFNHCGKKGLMLL